MRRLGLGNAWLVGTRLLTTAQDDIDPSIHLSPHLNNQSSNVIVHKIFHTYLHQYNRSSNPWTPACCKLTPSIWRSTRSSDRWIDPDQLDGSRRASMRTKRRTTKTRMMMMMMVSGVGRLGGSMSTLRSWLIHMIHPYPVAKCGGRSTIDGWRRWSKSRWH